MSEDKEVPGLREIEQHVEVCVRCQRELDRLSSDEKLTHWQHLLLNSDTGINTQGPLEEATADFRIGASHAAQDKLPQLSGYEVLRELGRGGMAVVYLAREEALGRLVAIKMLLAGALSGPEQLTRFRIEAETLARLKHPNIVQIHAVGEHNNLPFLVLEFVEGPTLGDVAMHRRPTPEASAGLISKVAQAVHFAHRQEVIHRDVKPANILLAPIDKKLEEIERLDEFDPKVTDFGLARPTEEERLTRTGSVIGTPHYMAPEQAAGMIAATAPVDVYAMGAVLYELLTGQPPFDGASTLEIVQKIQEKRPKSPRELNASVPKDLATIALKCLEKDPRDRYPTALDLSCDLDRFLTHLPITSRPIGPLGRVKRWCRRHPVAAALAGLLVAVVFVGGFLLFREARRNDQLGSSLSQSKYFERIGLAEDAWIARDRALLRETLDGCPEHLRKAEWGLLSYLAEHEPTALQPHASEVTCVVASADGQTIASSDGAGLVRLSSFPDGRHLFDVELGEVCQHLHFSSDDRSLYAITDSGRVLVCSLDERSIDIWPLDFRVSSMDIAEDRIAFGRVGGGIDVYDLSERERKYGFRTEHDVRALRIHPGKHTLIAVLNDSSTMTTMLSASATQSTVTTQDDANEFHYATIHEEQPIVAICQDDHVAKLIDSKNGLTRDTLYAHQGLTSAFAFCHRTERCASGGEGGKIVIWNSLNDFETELTLREHTSAVTALHFSTDGSHLIAGDADGNVLLHRLETSDLPMTRKLPGGGETEEAGKLRAMTRSRTESLLATAHEPGRLDVWKSDSLEHVRTFGPFPGLRGADFRSGTTEIALACDDNGLTILDVRTGSLIHEKMFAGMPLSRVAYSPSGQILAMGGGRDYRAIRLLNAGSLELVRELKGHDHTIRWLEFSPDGAMLATCGGSEVLVWDVASGNQLWKLKGHSSRVFSASFDQRGQRLTTSGVDATVRIWDLSTGQVIHVVQGSVRKIAFARFLDSGDRIGVINENNFRIIDAGSGQVVLGLPHGGMLKGQPWLPIGDGFVAGNLSGELLYWRLSP